MKNTEQTKYREELADDTDRRLTVCIVDDNPAALKVLADDLQAMPAIREVRTFSSYQEALLPLRDPDCDVLFLDVEMDGMNGLDYLHMIRQNGELPFHVVFYTAYSRYMLDAIRYSAADFLLKPYKHEELSGIVERLVMLVENSDVSRAGLYASVATAGHPYHDRAFAACPRRDFLFHAFHLQAQLGNAAF